MNIFTPRFRLLVEGKGDVGRGVGGGVPFFLPSPLISPQPKSFPWPLSLEEEEEEVEVVVVVEEAVMVVVRAPSAPARQPPIGQGVVRLLGIGRGVCMRFQTLA
ncbi:hypothetical protein E2C01_100569 [Portunus trituberculatus]|uniref:Uncharacterized protein n=1 Tax=Portunus trituberculatus TaxID=210409 RepID=A0A5B7KHX1_PORTR|nr:hypothetical protein [Portunus trituberculatus]